MFIDSLLSRGAMPVLEQVMSFTQRRQEVLANNISNLDTVGYKVKDLDADKFFASLSEAVEKRGRSGAGLQMRNSRNLHWSCRNHLEAKAVNIEDNNILFHDNNNRFIEKQMSKMSQNALLHNLATEMLRSQYGILSTAIKGRV